MSIDNSYYPTGWGLPQVKTGPIPGDRAIVKRQAELYRQSFSYMTPSHYTAHDMLVAAMFVGGRGQAFRRKRKVFEQFKVTADINKRHPALAAEQRVAGAKAERSIAAEMKRLRDWKKLNWAYYYGRGARG